MIKLWKLRLKVIDAYENLLSYKAIKSTKDKISGYTDRGILMNPEAMQTTIALLEKAKDTNDKISNFGRSSLKIKKTAAEEDAKEKEAESMVIKFGRSICTTTDTTALDRIKNIEEEKNLRNKNEPEKNFIKAMRELENYMAENKIKHSFRCKEEKLSDKDIESMIEEAELLEVEDQSDKIKVLRNIKKMKEQNLFQFCDKKPYQCLVCPYYYEDFSEFIEMKNIRKKENENEK
jgi:hypothetical protein